MGFFKRQKERIEHVEADVARIGELQQQAMAQTQAAMGGTDLQALMQQVQGMGMGAMAEQIAYRDRVMKLMQHGLAGRATLRAVREGASSTLAGTEVELDVEVTPPSGAAYAATIKQYMLAGAAERFAVGSELSVRIDPDDPQVVMIWGGASESAAPAAPTRVERLEELGKQRDAGTLTDEEFEQQKAKILAEP